MRTLNYHKQSYEKETIDNNCSCSSLGPVSRKSRKFFGPEKPFVKLRPAYSLNLVFLYVVKGIKIKITATFLTSRRLRFEDRELCHPKCARKVSGLSKNGPLVGEDNEKIFDTTLIYKMNATY